jgi:hypothetical protein
LAKNSAAMNAPIVAMAAYMRVICASHRGPWKTHRLIAPP